MNLKIDPQEVLGAQISRPGKGLKEIPDTGDFWLILFALLINPNFKSSIELSSENMSPPQIQEAGLSFEGANFKKWSPEGELSPFQGPFFSLKGDIPLGGSNQDFKEISREEITSELELWLKTLEDKGKEAPGLENLFYSLKEGKQVTQKTVLQAIEELSTLAKENNDRDLNSILKELLYLLRTNEVLTDSKKEISTDPGQRDHFFHVVETQGLKTDKVKNFPDNQFKYSNSEKIENSPEEWLIKGQIERVVHKKEGHIPSREETKDKQFLPWPPDEEKAESALLNKGQEHKTKDVSTTDQLFLGKPSHEAKVPEHLASQGHHLHHQVQQQANTTLIENKLMEPPGPHHPRPPISLEPSQIPDFVKELVLKPNRLGRNEARIRLEPPHLGELHVTLSVDKGEVRLLFTVEHPQAAQALHQEIHQLAKSLAEVGLQLGGCQIDLSGGKHQSFQEHLYPDFNPIAPKKELSLASSEAQINHRPRGLIDVRV